jgi:ABC-2 type transport system ATP-binding protein
MIMPIIETSNLTKSYGRVAALSNLSLQICEGEIFGFLGPNGAGKTTTIRLLLGLLKPTQGRATVSGLDAWRDAVHVHKLVGYVPGDVRLYEYMTGQQLLDMLSGLRRVGNGLRAVPTVGTARSPLPTIPVLAERLQLDLSRRIKTYSKGMKQKLGLMQALMHEPRLLILDEPTAALDPLMQEELYAILRERKQQGATIFFSSHILSEVEKICDRVGIVRAGHLVKIGSVDDVKHLQMRRVEVTFRDGVMPLEQLKRLGLNVRKSDDRTCAFTLRGDVDLMVKLLAQFHVETLTVEPLSLEDVFFEFYKGSSGVVEH